MLNTLKQFIRIFKSDDFMKNPNAPQISEADNRALLIGLINSEQTTSYCDSLTTGLPRERILQGLSEAWGVHNSEEALSILDWILNEGHRVIYNEVLPVLKIQNAKNIKENIFQIFNEKFQQMAERVEGQEDLEEIKEKIEHQLGRAVEFVDNLTECIKGRGNDDFVAFNDENMSKGILAWDLGRLVTVSRLASDAGFIDEPTAWDYIRKGYQMAIQEYATWKDLAAAYLIGRGAWGGDTMMLNGLYSIAKKSITEDKSPWRKTALK